MNVIRAIKTLGKYLFKPTPVAVKSADRLFVDTVSLRRIDPLYGDFLIHPCVRYIQEGFAGHHWWMAVTPFPRMDDRYENPVLYYGDGEGTNPPRNWNFVGVVQSAYPKGYNADCNLFFDGTLLWIFWKETGTPNTTPENDYNCVMGRPFDGRDFGPVKKFLDNPDTSANRMTAPVVLSIDGQICLLATQYERRVNDPVQPHGRSGLSLWKLNGNSLSSGDFIWESDIPQDYPDWFDFWHADFFEESGKYYCVVTTERATTMLMGASDDGLHYHLYPQPLLSKTGNLYTGMYKASAVLVDGKLHLFFPKKSINGKSSHIYCSSMGFNDLLRFFCIFAH